MLFVTGVFKNQGNQSIALRELRAHAFILKPFGGEELLECMRNIFGSQHPDTAAQTPVTPRPDGAKNTAELPKDGLLLQAPVPYFLWRISREKSSGILDIKTDAEKHMRLFFYRGRLALGQSTSPGLNLGAHLVREQRISQNDFETAAQQAVEKGKGLYDVLQQAKLLDVAGLRNVHRHLAPEILMEAFAATGRFRWTAGEEFGAHIPTASLPLEPLIKTALAQTDFGPLQTHLQPRSSLRLSHGPDWALVSPVLAEFCGADDLARLVNGRATIAQMIESSPNDEVRLHRLRQLFFLLCSNSVEVTAKAVKQEQPLDAATAGQTFEAPQPRAEASDSEITFSELEESSRRKIAAQFKRQKDQNHWEVLGVERATSPDGIRQAYFALAKEFHNDAFPDQNLGAMNEVLQKVFNRLTTAYKTLLDDSLRAEYERKLEMEAQGFATDIDKVFAAEERFLKGQTLMERGEYIASLDYFSEACELNPGSEVAQAYRQYVAWRIDPDESAAAQIIANINSHYEACPHEHVFLEFMGTIALTVGNTAEAIEYFKKCVKKMPKNINAQRSLRRLTQQPEKKSSSLFNRFSGGD